MIHRIGAIEPRRGLVMVQHVDGFGTPGQKLDTFHAVARPRPVPHGLQALLRRGHPPDVGRPTSAGSPRRCGSSASSDRAVALASPDADPASARRRQTRWRPTATGSWAPRPRWSTSTATRWAGRSKVTGPRLAAFVEQEWGGRLIRGWDERWFDLPRTLGDRLGGVCLGAGAGPGRDRRLDHRAALQADARRGGGPAGPDRDRARPRPVPDRPLRRRRRRRGDRADAALDRGRPLRRRDRRPAGRGGRAADRARGAQPRRLPVGLARRRAPSSPGSRTTPARWCSGTSATPRASVPVELDALGRRPRGRLHLQVPQRRPRLAGVPLRRGPAAGRADPADPGLDGRRGPVPDGAVVRPGRPASGGSSPARRRSSGCSRSRTWSTWSPRSGSTAVRAKSRRPDRRTPSTSPTSCSSPLGVELASPRDAGRAAAATSPSTTR